MASLMSRIRRLRGDRGAELIEMAIVTPVLLLIMAGIFDFGMMFRAWEVVTNAAREGARVGVLPGYADEDVRVRVEQYMQVSGVAATCSLQAYDTTTGACPAGTCNVCTATQMVTSAAGDFSARVVTVTSTQPLPSLSVFGTLFGGSFTSVDVGSTSTMRTEVALTPPAGP